MADDKDSISSESLTPAVSDKVKTDLIGTGIFLERDVYQLFKDWDEDRMFETQREVPYSYGTHPAIINGTVDVVAETSIDNGTIVLILPIECKKADPKLKHWVFEAHKQTRQKDMPMVLFRKDGENIFTQQYIFTNLGYNTYEDYENCVNVFEFSEANGQVSRNANRELRAFYAIKQANEAVPGLVDNLNAISKISRNPSAPNFIIPLVVTTANLFVTEYDFKDIKRATGDIAPDKLNLIKKDWVIYSYPLEFHESIIGKDNDRPENGNVRPEKRPTFIVNAAALPNFIKKLIADMSYFN
jgi:hypothetical protein